MSYKSLSDLEPNARELAGLSTGWMDAFWDEGAGLLWYPGYESPPDHGPRGEKAKRRSHLVRDTAWYTIGLFLRRQGPDVFRAIHAVHAILDYQFDAPDQPYHGTFARSPEEDLPPAAGAREWRDYDPNWREFIITPLQMLLAEYEPLLPHTLIERIDAATRLAVSGALARGLRAGYTNISLMHAFMLAAAGARLNEPGWLARGEEMAQAIYDLFQVDHAFEEYNSPTYYGPDLYALALWRALGPTPLLRRLGAEMEGRLWLDLSRYYSPGLRNLCGPYDRSYGMDMTRYAAVLGQWIWLVTGQAQAPCPALDLPFAHTSDWFYAPQIAFLGAAVPEEARARLLALEGPRKVEQVITRAPRRVASAYLEENFMWGGEHTSLSKFGSPQFHPVTLHWRAGPGQVGWMRLVHRDPVDATVQGRLLSIRGSGPLIFQICVPGLVENALQSAAWELPGLTVRVVGAPSSFSIERQPEWLEVRYDPGQDAPIALRLEI